RLERSVVRGDAPLLRIDRGDRGAEEADAAGFEEREAPGAVCQRAGAREVPQLGEPHVKVIAAVDERDVMAVAQQGPQLGRGRQAAEPAAQDYDAHHRSTLLLFERSVSAGRRRVAA